MEKLTDYTGAQFTAIQNIYNYYNANMFSGMLNNCVLNFSRKSKAYGFFAPERWGTIEASDTVHEISLNPEYLKRPPVEVISTLVHEMVHLWQQDHDTPAKGYHCKRFAKKMKAIGLYPSSTGQEGGKETGKNMSHYIMEGGQFITLWDAMPKEFLYPLVCVSEGGSKAKKAGKNKTKYSCPSCASNIWGKEGLHVHCDDCDEVYLRA
ncbi:MAG: SprT-like domain-containing protein [Ferruginibacter sp.]